MYTSQNKTWEASKGAFPNIFGADNVIVTLGRRDVKTDFSLLTVQH